MHCVLADHKTVPTIMGLSRQTPPARFGVCISADTIETYQPDIPNRLQPSQSFFQNVRCY